MSIQTAHGAVFVKAGQPLEIRSYPVTKPKSGHALLSLRLSGICGTDSHIMEGRLSVPPPFIPGHEFIGTIKQLGAQALKDGLGQSVNVSDTVIACVADPCGKCFNCRNSESANCLHFKVTNFRNPDEAPHFFGGFAEVLHQPARTLVRISNALPVDAVAAFPCAGPTAIHAFTRAGGLKKDEIVVVQGTGPVGLFAIAWARAAGCRVAALGSFANPLRTALARKLGAEVVWDYKAGSPADRCAAAKKWAARFRRGDGPDVVFEASGAPAAVTEGLDIVRTLGRYIVPGQYSSSGAVSLNPEAITFKAVTITGSSQYSLKDIGTYLAFLKKHPELHGPFTECITHRYRVSEAVTACSDASAGRAIKAVFAGEQ